MDLFILGSGSSGNAAIIRTSQTTILVDAGLSTRKILTRLASIGLDAGHIDAVLLTHEHSDHTGGLPVLFRSLRCPVFATRLTSEEVRAQHPRNTEISWRTFSTGSTFEIGTFQITAFSVPHDAADPVGFTVRNNSSTLGILTDLGHANRSVIHHVQGSQCLFVEANHDEKLLHADKKRPFSIKQRIMSSHGHLSNSAVATLANQLLDAGLRHIVLGHLSRDCNSPDIAVNTVRNALARNEGITVQAVAQDETLLISGIGAA